MSYPAKAVANFFIEKAIKEKDEKLDLMKLLKLIYIAHGWSLAVLNKPLISEAIEAWKYGPVVPDVYHSLKHFSLYPINEPIKDSIYKKNGRIEVDNYTPNFDETTKAILNKIWQTYKLNTGIDLSNWSHDENGPWFHTWQKCSNYSGQPGIPDTEIRNYFKKHGSAHEESI